MFANICSFTKNDPLCMAYHPYHFVGEVLLHPVYIYIYGPLNRPRRLLKGWHLFRIHLVDFPLQFPENLFSGMCLFSTEAPNVKIQLTQSQCPLN